MVPLPTVAKGTRFVQSAGVTGFFVVEALAAEMPTSSIKSPVLALPLRMLVVGSMVKLELDPAVVADVYPQTKGNGGMARVYTRRSR